MLLFSRILSTRGNPRHVMPWASTITEHLRSAIELDITCWQADFGYPVGTLAWGVAAAQHVEHVVGQQVAVFTEVYGAIGGITWISVAPDAAAVDLQRQTMAADATYMGMMAGTDDLFIAGSGRRVQVSRIA